MSANNFTSGFVSTNPEPRNPILTRMVDLELSRIVEHWRFEGDAVHILLTLPARGCVCGKEHCWFVNRDGRTRCWECDVAYVKDREHPVITANRVMAEIRAAKGMGA